MSYLMNDEIHAAHLFGRLLTATGRVTKTGVRLPPDPAHGQPQNKMHIS